MQVLKWIVIIVAIVALAVVALGTGLHYWGGSRLANAPEVEVESVTVPTDAQSIAAGEHLVNSVSLCAECHGEDLGGSVIIDEAPIGYIPAPNLTSGQGGVGAYYTDEDWVRALRHGIGARGQAFGIMPSQAFTHLTDEDLGSIIAYVKQAPPVDNDMGERRIMFPGTILFGLLGYGDLPHAKIDHAAAGSTTVSRGANAEFGGYLVKIAGCSDCHGSNLAGNPNDNGAPMGPNITTGGALADYNEPQFMAFMRSGRTPLGVQVSEDMPWEYYQGMTDEELQALWLFISEQEPLPDNT